MEYAHFLLIRMFNLGLRLNVLIIQHIVTLAKYGHGALNIRRPCKNTDILRYT